MSHATRPIAQSQRRIIGTARIETGAQVDVIAIANDQLSGRTFYVIAGSNGGAPFGVWPDELEGLAWCMPLHPTYTLPPETPNDREALRLQLEHATQMEALASWRDRGVL